MKLDAINDGSEVLVYHTRLPLSNSVGLMLRCYAELIESGHGINSAVGFGNDSQIIWCEHNNEPIGGVCFLEQTYQSQAWINFSFTDPLWRRKGVNELCYRHLEEYLKSKGIKSIASHVHINNVARLESFKRIGLKPEFYRMSKNI